MKTAVVLDERGILEVAGSQRRPFLQGLISADVEQVTAARAAYGALLTPQGKFLFDFFIAELGDAFLLDTDTERLPELQKRLTMYKLRSDVTLTDRSGDLAAVALLGDVPGLDETAGTALPCDGGIVYTDPRSARLKARAMLPRTDLAQALARIGFEPGRIEDYERHRIAVGAPDARRDLEADRTLLLEANFDAFNGVSFGKGCFVGQELTARTKYRGNVRRRLYPVALDGTAAPGARVAMGDKEVGDLRSVAGDRGIAMLRIEDVEKAAAENLPLTADGAVLRIESVAP